VKLYAILTVALIAAGGGVIVLASLFYYPFQPNPMQYNIASESRDKNPVHGITMYICYGKIPCP
jgi:hypothetical protein